MCLFFLLQNVKALSTSFPLPKTTFFRALAMIQRTSASDGITEGDSLLFAGKTQELPQIFSKVLISKIFEGV